MRRRGRAGVSLADTLVAAAVFAGLLVIVVSMQMLSRKAMRKADVHTETWRAAVIGLDHVRRELRGANVLDIVDDGRKVRYLRPIVSNGLLDLTAGGDVAFEEPTQAHSITVSVAGDLVCDDRATLTPRMLARLGPSGEVRFSWDPAASRLLHVRLRAVITDPYGRPIEESTSTVEADLFVPEPQ